MIIKAYGERPVQYAPDEGEIILARRTAIDVFTLAVVEKAWRTRDGHLKLRIVWLDDNPHASRISVPHQTPAKLLVKAGVQTWLTLYNKMGESPLVRQIDADKLPRTPVSVLEH